MERIQPDALAVEIFAVLEIGREDVVPLSFLLLRPGVSAALLEHPVALLAVGRLLLERQVDGAHQRLFRRIAFPFLEHLGERAKHFVQLLGALAFHLARNVTCKRPITD